MKNALILTGVWLGILVTAYAIVFWDQGIDRPLPISVLEQQIQTVEPEYVHPDGLFSVSIPMGWQMAEDMAIARMTDPNEYATVWIVATDTAGLDDVLDEGFEYDGVVYRSLSAVATAITGSHWNGKLFFGITKRKKTK